MFRLYSSSEAKYYIMQDPILPNKNFEDETICTDFVIKNIIDCFYT